MIPGLGPIPVTPPLGIGSCLAWVTKQPQWPRKVVIGGLWSLASLTIVGLPFLLGYIARVIRAGFAGGDLPSWDRLGALYREGLAVGTVWLAHWGPFGGLLWAASRLGVLPSGDPHGYPFLFLLLVVCGAAVILIVALYVNTAILRMIVLGGLRVAFEAGENAEFARRNAGNFGRWLVLLVPANWIAQASCCLCGIGLLPGSFWATCTSGYGLGQVGRCDLHLSKQVRGAVEQPDAADGAGLRRKLLR